MEFEHLPILKDEIIDLLNIKPNGVYVDCTVGGAGHSSAICEKLSSDATLICFDKDLEALNVSKERLSKFSCNKIFIHSDFHAYKEKLQENGINKVDGVLIDLGVSSYQLDNFERGFSYMHDGRLDMRMDQTKDFSAYNVVNEYSPQNLTKILYEYGEEQFTKSIVNNIIKQRGISPISTTKELVDIINSSVPAKVRIDKTSVKRVFQAIRIEVNGELEGLENTLKDIIDSLSIGGRFAVLTFHSLEDRIVKNLFKLESTNCICDKNLPICVCNHKASVNLVNRKPIVANDKEIKENSRSKSAKLRVIEKVF
ncbi:MAG: 16S rRNA (cytosine(1402)-N(4))-methyltransferase RsmH [Clostridiales bacterium]|nr:16S rRNA (cytosine(1402)-N(4))-methyltransferase RsmH [Clostridiales bacterium]